MEGVIMNQEKAYFHHCLEVEECTEGLIPRRFTEKQLTHWASLGEVRSARARATAGITICFTTSAPEIRFSYHVKCVCGEKMSFEMYEGNHLTRSVTIPSNTREGSVVFERLYCGEEGKAMPVTIYLPFTAELALSHFEFGEDACPVPEEARTRRILWLGDSIHRACMHHTHHRPLWPSCSAGSTQKS